MKPVSEIFLKREITGLNRNRRTNTHKKAARKVILLALSIKNITTFGIIKVMTIIRHTRTQMNNHQYPFTSNKDTSFPFVR